MCYVIITSASLVWFLCSLVADMLFAVALVTPKWLLGPAQAAYPRRQSSVGIYTRCKVVQDGASSAAASTWMDWPRTAASIPANGRRLCSSSRWDSPCYRSRCC